MSSLKGYLDSTGCLPEDALLGSIAMPRVSDLAYPREQIVTLFDSLELDASLIPPDSNPLDAFNKATRNKEFEYTMPNGSLGVLRTENLTSPNPREITMRAIVRKEQVARRPGLSFSKMGEVRLYRPQRRKGAMDPTSARFLPLLDREGCPPAERQAVESFLETLARSYERYRDTLDGVAVRTLMRRYLRGPLMSVPLKESVHFVPVAKAGEMHRLFEATKHIEGVRMDLVPLVDLVDQREVLMRSFQEDREAELGSLAAELMEAANVKAPRPATLGRLQARYTAIMERTEVYADLLGESTARTSTTADIVKASLHTLARKVMKTAEESS